MALKFLYQRCYSLKLLMTLSGIILGRLFYFIFFHAGSKRPRGCYMMRVFLLLYTSETMSMPLVKLRFF